MGVRMTPLGKSDAPGGGAVRSRYDQLQPPPEAPARLAHRPARLRHHRRAEVRHDLVAGTHGGPPRGRSGRTASVASCTTSTTSGIAGPRPQQFEDYKQYFPRPAGSLVGEKTPGYLYQPWVPPMLTGRARDAKLIVLMRDPVERYISNLGLLVRAGVAQG